MTALNPAFGGYLDQRDAAHTDLLLGIGQAPIRRPKAISGAATGGAAAVLELAAAVRPRYRGSGRLDLRADTRTGAATHLSRALDRCVARGGSEMGSIRWASSVHLRNTVRADRIGRPANPGSHEARRRRRRSGCMRADRRKAEAEVSPVEVFIGRIRKKINCTGACIRTVRGLGYLLAIDNMTK